MQNKLKTAIQNLPFSAINQARSIQTKPVPKAWLAKPSSKGDVILLSGIYGRWHSLKNIGEMLHRNGYRVHVIERLGLNAKPIGAITQELNEYLTKNDLKDVVIVGFSKGGLVGLSYLIDHPNGRVIKLIAIATPFSGSNIGKLFRLPSVRELMPNSQAIQSLRPSQNVLQKIVSIHPQDDDYIWHQNGSTLQGATNIRHQVAGHHRVLFDRQAQESVLAEVNKAFRPQYAAS